MNDTITHIASFPVDVGDETIQRCAYCGEVLAHMHSGCAVAIPKDATDEQVAHARRFIGWEAGALVQVAYGNPSAYSLLPIPEEIDGRMRLPDDCCARIGRRWHGAGQRMLDFLAGEGGDASPIQYIKCAACDNDSHDIGSVVVWRGNAAEQLGAKLRDIFDDHP
jgi:hypothetical protein